MTAPLGRRSLEPWLPDEVLFYQHQLSGVRELVKRRNFLLCDDLGLGKSLTSLAVFAIDVQRKWAETLVVVCPKTLKWNWVKEITKFTRFPFIALEGAPAKRRRQIVEYLEIKGPKILILTYEETYLHRIELENMPFDILICDEAHYIKNPLARRTKSVLELNSRRSFMLTGTPLLNKIDELWCLLHRVSPEKYPNYYAFINKYGVYGGYKGKQLIGVKNEKELERRVHDVMLRRKKEDVLDLPPVQIIQRRVEMHTEQQELYDKVADELKLLRYDEDDDEEIDNALTKFLRLKQICGTTQPFTGRDVSAKLDLATEDDMEILANGHKIVVFTQFRAVQEVYIQRMKTLVPKIPIFSINGDTKSRERMEIVDTWSAVKGPAIFVGMLQVASEGITLTAARHGSFLDKLFTPGKNKQAVDRLHRIGSSKTQAVQIREYITRKSVEIRIEQINRDKSKLVAAIIGGASRDRNKKLLKLILESREDDNDE